MRLTNKFLTSGVTIDMKKELKPLCKFCGSDDLVYHQYVIYDYSCQSCGEWQDNEEVL